MFPKWYYIGRHDITAYAARRIMSLVLDNVPRINSVVDFGCGVGTWLQVCRDMLGTVDILGLDGSWLPQDALLIPRERFRVANLADFVELDEHYDLAIGLEVVEHIPAEYESNYINSLVCASNIVLFSAAAPRQPGFNHVNCQWPTHWVELFVDLGYVPYDFIRPAIWGDIRIPWWYRQNVLLFVHADLVPRIKQEPVLGDRLAALNVVHPVALNSFL